MMCKLEWVKNFYPVDLLKKVDYGCYSPSVFIHEEKDGVMGAWIHEGVCPIHGTVCSPLGGIPQPDKLRHPCGAYVQETQVQELPGPLEV